MKRILTILSLAAAFLTACQEESLLSPAASLFSPTPELTDTTAIFRLAVANIKAGDKAVTFPVHFEGSAKKGVDYITSGEEFVFGGESPIDSIVVTTLRLGTEKTLRMTVMLPEGFEAGKYTTSEFTLHDKYAYLSFSKEATMTADSVDIGFIMTDKKGKAKSHRDSVEVFININKEKSTAEEGVDFEFSDSSYFIFRPGVTNGALEIRSLKPVVESGRDKIVMNLSFGDDFGAGEIQEIEIDLLDRTWSAIEGTWKAASIVTDSLYMEEYWKEACTGYNNIPELNTRDNIKISLLESSFVPTLRSDLKNYFIDASSMRKGKIVEMVLPDGTTSPVQTFLLDNTNRFFSKKEKSEDKVSYIGMRLISGEGEDETLLDMYIIDHMSKSFMPELESSGKYSPEKPVAASPGLYLNMLFSKE